MQINPIRWSPNLAIRTTLLPFDSYQNLFCDTAWEATAEHLVEFFHQPVQRAMLAFSSPTLLSESDRLHGHYAQHPKAWRKLAVGLAKYAIRATTRPTPFGMFSGIAPGHWGEEHAPSFGELCEHQIDFAPDMQLLLDSIKQIERDPILKWRVKWSINPLCRVRGQQLHLSWKDEYGQGGLQSLQLEITDPLHFILNHLSEPTTYDSICQALLTHYQLDGDYLPQLQTFLDTLIEHQVLLSTLRPPMLGTAPLNHLMAELSGLDHHSPPVAAILGLATSLQALAAEGLEHLSTQAPRILTQHGFHPGKIQSVVNVTTRLQFKSAQIDQRIAQELNQAALCLTALCLEPEQAFSLQSYTPAFVERYGYQEVPVLDLLDPSFGLGPPAGFDQPAPIRWWDSPPLKPSPARALLTRLVGEALWSGDEEVILTDEDLKDLRVPDEQIANSFDIVATVFAKDDAAVRDGDFMLQLGPMGGLPPMGIMSGRFASLEPSCRGNSRELQLQEQESEEVLFADLNYLHPQGRFNNVGHTPHLRRYQVTLATTPGDGAENICPQDIVVGFNGTQLYLKDRKRGRRLLVQPTNMIDPRRAPNLVRFLIEVSQQGFRRPAPLDLGHLSQFPVLPRIRYGKSLLLPRMWLIPFRLARLDHQDGEFSSEYLAWRSKYRVPRHVQMGLADNKLLLDLDNELHQMIFAQNCQQGIHTVEEDLLFTTGSPLSDSSGQVHVLELCASFTKRLPTPHLALPSKPDSLIENQIGWPLDSCIYLKLFTYRSLEPLLLGRLAHLWQDPAFESRAMFFIRYTDPQRQLRLRILDPKRPIGQLIECIIPLLVSWIQEGLLISYSFHPYEPEVTRYGGRSALSLAEQVFSVDSRMCIDLLNSESSLSEELRAMLSADLYLINLGFSSPERLRIYSEIPQDAQTKSAISAASRAHGRTLRSWLSGAEADHPLQGWREQLHSALGDLGDRIRHEVAASDSAVSFPDVGAALLHMHFNRLGIDPEKEVLFKGALRNAYRGLEHQRPAESPQGLEQVVPV